MKLALFRTRKASRLRKKDIVITVHTKQPNAISLKELAILAEQKFTQEAPPLRMERVSSKEDALPLSVPPEAPVSSE